MDKFIDRGFILSLDYFYHNINTYILNKILLSFNNNSISGLKINSYDLILDMKYSISMPIIGYSDRLYPNNLINVTPTIKEICELTIAGASIIYLDASTKIRPDFITIHEFYYNVRELFPEIRLIGEVCTREDIRNIVSLKFDGICIRGDSNLIEECYKYVDSNTLLMLDCTYSNIMDYGGYVELFDKGFNNLIISSKIFTPQYNVDVFIEEVFSQFN